ncbi:polysaccharide deacetylase family protein [Sneathiella sp.]|jgi:peptidoglycan/xylan/chitin deacetylase (PgdA/CDA1 family)|uniref:polysaccharide deacetylase family protein n=1 Tax=Sneathiella sp. TaxID=1964365 RepID=UPI0039E651E8
MKKNTNMTKLGHIGRQILLAASVFVPLIALPGLAAAADWASVIMYHRFGDGKYPSTNIKLDQFKEHLQELKAQKYTVLPLGQIVDKIQSGQALPDRTVAITIDDAYLSVYENAWPLLKEAGFPFTIFTSTDALDKKIPDYMSWAQLKEMVDAGVYVGHHTATHRHLPALSIEQVKEDIQRASASFEKQLGFVPGILAYPYGEYGREIKDVVKQAGFKAAFGQQSGVFYSGSDMYGLPRFALSEAFGSIGRLRLAANAMPLRVKQVMPKDNILKRNPPAFGFTLAEQYSNLNQLSCFSSNQSGGAVPIERLGNARVEVRLSKAYSAGRGRINCTLPGPEGRYRWFGALFYIPRR